MLPTTSLRALLAAALVGSAAAAALLDRKTNSSAVQKVLIGGGPSGMVGAADFDGKSFKIVANDTIPDSSASWMLFKEPNLLYAVDENSNITRLFNVGHPPGTREEMARELTYVLRLHYSSTLPPMT